MCNFLQGINWVAVSTLLSLLAIILSQMRPVRQILKGKKLKMLVGDTVTFSHYFGNTNINLWMDLENVGGKRITVGRIIAILARKEGAPQILTARTYWVTESFSRERPFELPLSDISLKPDEKWSGILHFYDLNIWTKTNEGKVKALISKIRDDISQKLKNRDKELESVPLLQRTPVKDVEADEQLVKDAHEIVNSLKRVEKGEYELLVAALETPNGNSLKILGFDLTIFENDEREIFEDINEYKFGFGVHLPSNRNKYVDVRLGAKSESDTKKRFNAIWNVSK